MARASRVALGDVPAQASVFEGALEELRAGPKRTHWMWFIFPQLTDLGLSPTARLYGLASLLEARAYLNHPLLSSRLETAVAAVQSSRVIHCTRSSGRRMT